MAERTVIPFGPQHPVLPEPIHLDLVMEDELVVEALPSVGFVHRGLEKLAEKHEFEEMVFVAERICGICSFIHGQGYCQAVEKIAGIEIPERAVWLRTYWGELSRIHSHLLWLGLFADAFGFESLFQHTWRIREMVVDIIEETAGGRVIFGSCKVGGVRRDIPNDRLRELSREFDKIEAECRTVIETFRDDSTVRRRTEGLGILKPEDARALGAVGPTLRGSGIREDARTLGYAAFSELEWSPVTYDGCDCYSRCLVRMDEVYQSFSLLRQIAEKIPEGDIDLKRIREKPNGTFMARLEQPRGEVCYFVEGNGAKKLSRFRVRTPTFANVAPLVHMLKGCDLADVPVIILTIDPCISCNER
jgi:ech hydrogenase subunit E